MYIQDSHQPLVWQCFLQVSSFLILRENSQGIGGLEDSPLTKSSTLAKGIRAILSPHWRPPSNLTQFMWAAENSGQRGSCTGRFRMPSILGIYNSQNKINTTPIFNFNSWNSATTINKWHFQFNQYLVPNILVFCSWFFHPHSQKLKRVNSCNTGSTKCCLGNLV